MKILLIGGTGVISEASTRRFIAQGHDVWLLNRGNRPLPEGAHSIVCDIYDEPAVCKAIADHYFDTVAQFVAYTPQDVARDIRLFTGRCTQYIFISSASAYQKPVLTLPIDESVPLINPFWEYSRQKAAAEEYLSRLPQGAPAITIVRPSHTYCERSLPLAVKGHTGPYSVLRRILNEQPVVIHGDGESLWTITHSEDFALGFCALANNPAAFGETVHITADEHLSWNEIYRILAQHFGKPLHAVYLPSSLLAQTDDLFDYDLCGSLLGDKACSVWFDTEKIHRLAPEFTVTISAKEGLGQCVDWYLSHPEHQQPDEAFDRFCDRAAAAYAAAKAVMLA